MAHIWKVKKEAKIDERQKVLQKSLWQKFLR